MQSQQREKKPVVGGGVGFTEEEAVACLAMKDVPLRLRTFVKRLVRDEDNKKYAVSILFIVRLADSLHRAFYATFLTQSLTAKLCQHLLRPSSTATKKQQQQQNTNNNDGNAVAVETVVLELSSLQMNSTTWNVRQGQIVVTHRMALDYDMQTVAALTKIANAVLDNRLSAAAGLQHIRQYERSRQQKNCNKERAWFRDFPGRAWVLPAMSSTCAAVYFDGTWIDFGFAGISGVAAGLVAYLTDRYSKNETITGIADYIVAIVTALISMASVWAFFDDDNDAVCFSAQVMGTLYWFFYGTAFVLGVYEMSNLNTSSSTGGSLVLTGLTRFGAAIIRTYGLAVGVLLGVWFSAYLGADARFDSMQDQCNTKTGKYQISDLWFILLFPVSAVSCLMQFRVAWSDFGIGLIVQTIAYGSQYVIGTIWKQPPLVENLVPAFLAVLASQACIWCLQWRKYYAANNRMMAAAYRGKKSDNDDTSDDGHHHARSLELGNGDSVGCDREESNNSEDTTDWTERSNNSSSSKKDKTGGGYLENDLDSYCRSDIWSPLLPAIYLLVPGSKLLQTAFIELLGGLEGTNANPDEDASDISSLASSLFSIALGQVVGLRLGFAVLSAGQALMEFYSKRRGRKQHASSTNGVEGANNKSATTQQSSSVSPLQQQTWTPETNAAESFSPPPA